MGPPRSLILPDRWTPLLPHAQQSAYYRSPHRFNVLPCGRRSGKTELFKRKLIKRALRGTKFDNARFFAAAPTNDQAGKIYWQDLKLLTPRWALATTPSESHRVILFRNGSEIHVVGMDKPERIEGQPWDGGGLDEYGNMKQQAWSAHVRPALSDRLGWCDFLGVPEGKNHYFDLYEFALGEQSEKPDGEWGVFEWESRTVLDLTNPGEVEAARRELHPLMFSQEYEGKFVDFSGVAIFDIEKMLDNGKPIDQPRQCDAVFAVIDTAVKTGASNDATAVVFFALSRGYGTPLVVLDWDCQQIEGALLETWLPTVFERLEALSFSCRARMGSLGALIEDKVSGMVLLQTCARRGWPAKGLPGALTALGKDERALSVSGHHYTGKCKMSREAYDKVSILKGQSRNHLLRQISDFRIGDPDSGKRSDDLLDCYTYGLSVSFGNYEGL